MSEVQEIAPIVLGHRAIRGLMYFCLMLAGIAVFFIPLAFFDRLQDLTIGAVGLFLIVGGTVSGAGHLWRIIVLERAGYPLIITALAALCSVLFVEAQDNAARTFIGLLIMALTLGLYGRWRDLGVLRRVNIAAAGVASDEAK